MGDGIRGFDLPASVVVEDDRPMYVCPKCGGELQFTEEKYGSIDPSTGEAYDKDYDPHLKAYCQNDCFMLDIDDGRIDGDIVLSMACEALGLPYPGEIRIVHNEDRTGPIEVLAGNRTIGVFDGHSFEMDLMLAAEYAEKCRKGDQNG